MSAAESLYTSLKRLREKALAQARLDPASFDLSAAEDEEEPDLPSLETRVNAARLFIDVGMLQQALEVLKTCLEENDEDVRTHRQTEIGYCCSCCCFCCCSYWSFCYWGCYYPGAVFVAAAAWQATAAATFAAVIIVAARLSNGAVSFEEEQQSGACILLS